MLKKIKKELMLEKNGVFIILYCESENKEYNYEHKVLMSMRWDNTLGFIGGKVDNNESLKEALLRETKEEINYDLDTTKVKHLISYNLNGFGIHSYTLKITTEEMFKIKNNYLKASHSEEEINGLCVLNIKKGELNKNLLKNNFCATSKLELKKLIKILSKENK